MPSCLTQGVNRMGLNMPCILFPICCLSQHIFFIRLDPIPLVFFSKPLSLSLETFMKGELTKVVLVMVIASVVRMGYFIPPLLCSTTTWSLTKAFYISAKSCFNYVIIYMNLSSCQLSIWMTFPPRYTRCTFSLSQYVITALKESWPYLNFFLSNGRKLTEVSRFLSICTILSLKILISTFNLSFSSQSSTLLALKYPNLFLLYFPKL